ARTRPASARPRHRNRQASRGAVGRIRAFLASRSETTSGEFVLPMLTGVRRVRQLEKPHPIFG
ncbi:MAG: hypothetical protein ACQSGP_18300, partial [Frankia sp.]